MKKQFLDELEKLLFALNEEEKAEILYFYKERIENGVFEGKTEEQVINSLEKPKVIAKNIYKEYGVNSEAFIKDVVEDHKVEKENKPYYEYKHTMYEKVMGALMGTTTLVVITLYLYLGFVHGAWAKGTILFIIIPLVATLIETVRNIAALPGLMVFVSTLLYLNAGFNNDRWVVGLLWFMLIPITGALVGPFASTWDHKEEKEYFVKQVYQEELKKEEEKANVKVAESTSDATRAFAIIGALFFDLVFATGILGGLFGLAIGMASTLSIIVVPAWIGFNVEYLTTLEIVTLSCTWLYLFIVCILLTFLAVELFIFVAKYILILNLKAFGYKNSLGIDKIKRISIIRKTKRTRNGSFRKTRFTFKFTAILSIILIILPIVSVPMLVTGDTFVNRMINDEYLQNNTYEYDNVDKVVIKDIDGIVEIRVDANLEKDLKLVHYYDFNLKKDLSRTLSDNDTDLELSNYIKGTEKYFRSTSLREKLVVYVKDENVTKIEVNHKSIWVIKK